MIDEIFQGNSNKNLFIRTHGFKFCELKYLISNSRSENFEDIYEDAKYDNDLRDVIVIEDRKEAIIQGSKLINDNDCMLILGKGHEETQEINGIISHFSDYEVVYEIYS